MRIREEDCNLILLAVVTLFTAAIAGGATLIKPAERNPVQLADRSAPRAQKAPAAETPVVYVADQPPVRVVGAPFVPNTNPRER